MADALQVVELVNVGTYELVHHDATDAALVDMWLNTGKRADSPRTQEQYTRTWRAFAAFVQKPLQAITLQDLLTWQQSLTGAPATRSVKTKTVRSLFAFAQKTGYLRANPAVMLDTGSVADTKHRKLVDETSVLRLLDKCQTPRERALVHVLYSSGARVSELLALTWQDVEPRPNGAAVLHILYGKGNKQREPGISVSAYSALLALRDESTEQISFVFATRTGRPLDRQAAHRLLKSVAKRAGVTEDFSAHWLRHSHATHALLRGAPVQNVMAQLGHSSLAVTSSYAHAEHSSADVLVL
mgnify:CR=1 FL=1